MNSATSTTRAASRKGFTLVEALVYAAGMVLIVGAIAGFLYYMYSWYRSATVGPRIDQAAIETIAKLEGDIRSGSTVNASGSSFGTAQGALSITSTANSVSTTTVYSLSNGRIAWQQNGGTVSYLTPSDLSVTGFWIDELSTSNSTAIHFELDIAYATTNGTTTNSYTGMSILRQSYQ